MDMSDDSVAAYTQLADVLNRVAPEYRDELVVAINGLIEARISDVGMIPKKIDTPCHQQHACIRGFDDDTCGEQEQCSIVLAILQDRARRLKPLASEE